jgi:hypothetical protein
LAQGSASADWNALAGALRTLHAALLKRVRAQYVKERGLADSEVGPGELLMLATRDESFAWLRSLSELMSDIDELHESAAGSDDARLQAAVRSAVEALLAPASAGAAPTSFQENYWRHVHDDPEVTIAHSAVRQSLRAWPAGGQPNSAIAQHLDELRKSRRS